MSVRFSASNAARLAACPASANLDKAILGWVPPVRDETKGAKAVGTSVHKILEDAAHLSAKDLQHLASILQYVGQLRSTRRFKVLPEAKLTAEWLQSQPSTTVDLALYTTDELHVLDYKWGLIPVDVHDNDQLLYYAACLIHLAPRAKGVTLHILQPRAGNMESVFVSTTELGAWMKRMQAAEARVLAGDLTFGPSDHCTFCPAYPHSRGDKGKPLCPATLQLLYPPVVDEQEILGLT